jgi:hypothetical protein
MKNAFLFREILIIILIVICTGFTAYFTFYNERHIGKVANFFWGASFGCTIGYAISYWTTKKNILENEQINGESAIRIWQYITIMIAVLSLSFQILYLQQFFTGLKPTITFFFIWAMVNGNFKSTIEPNYENLTVYMDDVEINKKTKRFIGKYLVFGGLVGVTMMLILPEELAFYLFGFYFLCSVAVQYFYAKYLFNKKYV